MWFETTEVERNSHQGGEMSQQLDTFPPKLLSSFDFSFSPAKSLFSCPSPSSVLGRFVTTLVLHSSSISFRFLLLFFRSVIYILIWCSARKLSRFSFGWMALLIAGLKLKVLAHFPGFSYLFRLFCHNKFLGGGGNAI